MNLSLTPSVAAGYKSPTQKARVITEYWAGANLYCPACSSDHIEALRPNTVVTDYVCPGCAARYQLKSTSRSFGGSVTNSAYEPKREAILTGRVPHYAFLRYSPLRWRVIELFIVPGYFITPNVIQKRAPLGPTARRAGWTGSNILLRALPPEARVSVISNEQALPPAQVRNAWNRFAFLGTAYDASGGWGADVLICAKNMQLATGSNIFSLADFYQEFKGHLAALHPENHNVKAKIRQQLQILRENRVLLFLGGGRYQILG